MHETERLLPSVRTPALVVQASKDPTVNPVSATLIFDKLGTNNKELAVFERTRHGIINGVGSEAVFERVFHFLRRTLREPWHYEEVQPDSELEPDLEDSELVQEEETREEAPA